MTQLIDREAYIAQPDYAKALRPLLPEQAFAPDTSKLTVLLLNLFILITGWAIARQLHLWNWYWLWLYLPLAMLMGNSVIASLFSTHDLMHSRAIKHPGARRWVGLLGLTMLWMPPTLWKAVHNREHHNKTNSHDDPDRNYLYEHPNNWGKWIQNLFVPSAEVNRLWLTIGMAHAWGVHAFRNLSSVLLFNHGETEYPVVSFTVSEKDRRAIAVELVAMIGLHVGIVTFVGLHPINLLLGYFLPIWIGYSGLIFYIYTNHMLCQMTEVNDPLINSVSLRVPKIFDLLHFNFSYHTEHHIFPGLNSNYYPLVRRLLVDRYEERFNLLDAGKAWRLMLETPRHYKADDVFTDWSGQVEMTCPLSDAE